MEELRNILIYVRQLKRELQKENNTNENIKFNIDSIIERAEQHLKREKEEAERKLKQAEELEFLITEYLKK